MIENEMLSFYLILNKQTLAVCFSPVLSPGEGEIRQDPCTYGIYNSTINSILGAWHIVGARWLLREWVTDRDTWIRSCSNKVLDKWLWWEGSVGASGCRRLHKDHFLGKEHKRLPDPENSTCKGKQRRKSAAYLGNSQSKVPGGVMQTQNIPGR